MARTITEARVVSWEPTHPRWQWGVAVRYDDGQRAMWPVGDRDAAAAEVANLVLAAARLHSV